MQNAPFGAFCNTFDVHYAIIGLENHILVFLRVAVVHRLYCKLSFVFQLEYTIAQQQAEIRGLKDKLSSHDAAAKRAIAALQNEMKARVDQVLIHRSR